MGGETTQQHERESPAGLKHVLNGILSGVHSVSHFVVRSSASALNFSRRTKPPEQNDGENATARPSKTEVVQMFVPNVFRKSSVPSNLLRKGSAPPPNGHLSNREKLEAETLATRRLESQLSQHVDKVLASHQELSRALQQTSVKRMATLSDRKQLMERFNFANESMQSLLGVLGMLAAGPYESLDWNDFRSRIQAAADDQSQVYAFHAQLFEQDLGLIDLDEGLTKRSAHFATISQSLLSDIGVSSHVQRPNTPGSIRYSPERPQSDAPSLLTQYLERRSDIAIFEERLANIEYEHEESLRQREIQRDRHEQPVMTEEAFESEYQAVRLQALLDLQGAENDTAKLELACKQRGLDTTYEHRHSEESSPPPDDLDLAADYIMINRHSRRRDSHVNDWVQQLPAPSVGGETGTNHVNGSASPRTGQIDWAPSTWMPR